MGKTKLLTTDGAEFLKDEFNTVFSRVFKNQETFEQEMQKFLRTCVNCKSFHWLSEEKRCDCDIYPKNDNHAKQTH